MDGSTGLRELAREHRDEILAHVGQTGMAISGLVALLAGVGVMLRWSHLREEVLSRPAAVIWLVVGALTVLVWIVFTLRRVTVTRIGVVLLAVGALVGAGVYAGSTREPLSAPPVAIALLLIPFLAFLAIAFRAVDLPRIDARDTTLPAMSWPVALPFKVLAFVLSYAALWAMIDGGSLLTAGRPLVAIHYGTAALGFSVVGVLRARATAAWAALAGVVAVVVYLPAEASWLLIASAGGTSSTDGLVCLVLMLALIPALLRLAHLRAATSPTEVAVEA